MRISTKGECYSRLIEYLRKAQEESATMAHLINEGDARSRALATGWLTVSEGLKAMLHNVTKLATRGLN